MNRTPKLCFGLTAAGLTLCLSCGGCVRRTITIMSEPSGALVWLNDREVGRTPLDVEFIQYGTYDVRLERDGFEPMSTSGDAVAPWWDTAGPDFVSELLPTHLHSTVEWNYVLQPVRDNRDELIERARELRSDAGDTGH